MKNNQYRKIYLFLLLAFLYSSPTRLYSQKSFTADALVKSLSIAGSDTAKLNILLQLCDVLSQTDIKKAKDYLEQATRLSEATGYQVHRVYFVRGKIQEAGGNPGAALANFYKALELTEKKIGEKGYQAQIVDRIAEIYLFQKNFKDAILYRERAIQLCRDIHDTEGISISIFNLGNIYYTKGELDLAIEKYKEAIPYFQIIHARQYTDAAYNNLGAIYFTRSDYPLALNYFRKSYLARLKADNIYDLASSMNNMGETFTKMGKGDSALFYCKKAFDLSQKAGLYEVSIAACQNLSLVYENMNDFKTAIFYHKLFEELKDSLFNTESQKQVRELSVKYESDKKEKLNEILSLQLKNESFIRYIIIIIAILIFISSLLLYRSYRLKKRANESLSEKNKIISDQHKDITDSIQYARRIQQAILPPDKFWFEVLPHSFVFYQPKDILSGDFYWIETREGTVYVAAADCTGHGVPGALMSIVNTNLLNKAVLEENLKQPNTILDEVNKWLTIALHQNYKEQEVRDGMDLALCAFIPGPETKLLFSGAYNGGYIFKPDGTCIEMNGDKKPVGAFLENLNANFTLHTYTVSRGDKIYLFSDGYADQFGGPKGKKLKYALLKKIINDSIGMSMLKQKQYLSDKFNEWKGVNEQVDDVLVIGFEI